MNSSGLVDLNEAGDLQKRLQKLRDEVLRYEPEPLSLLEKRFKNGDRAERDGHSKRGNHVRGSLRFAATEFVAGASTEKFREILRSAARDFAPTVPLFDHTPFDKTIAVAKSQAKKFASGKLPHDHGQVFLAPSKSLGSKYTNVTLKVRKQPAQF